MASVQVDGGKQTTKEVTSKSIPHNFRLHENYSNKDIDKSRTYLNQHFGCKTADEARAKFLMRVAACDAAHPPVRIKQDRKTALEICIPSPREGLDPDKEREFYAEAYSEMEKLFGKDNVIYGVTHFDEIHEFYDPRDKQMHISRSGLHFVVVPFCDDMDFIPDEYKKGLNMNSFYRRQCFQPNMLNERLDEVCQRVFGFDYQDGTKNHGTATIEQLKEGSERIEKQLKEIDANQDTIENQTEDIAKNERTMITQEMYIQDAQEQIDEAIEKAGEIKQEADEYAVMKKKKADSDYEEKITDAEKYATEKKADAEKELTKVVVSRQLLDKEYEEVEGYKDNLRKEVKERLKRIDSMKLNNSEFFEYIKSEKPELYKEIKITHKEYTDGLKKMVEIQDENERPKSEVDIDMQVQEIIQHYKDVDEEYEELQEQKKNIEREKLPVSTQQQDREIPDIETYDDTQSSTEKSSD